MSYCFNIYCELFMIYFLLWIRAGKKDFQRSAIYHRRGREKGKDHRVVETFPVWGEITTSHYSSAAGSLVGVASQTLNGTMVADSPVKERVSEVRRRLNGTDCRRGRSSWGWTMALTRHSWAVHSRGRAGGEGGVHGGRKRKCQLLMSVIRWFQMHSQTEYVPPSAGLVAAVEENGVMWPVG